MVQPTVNRREDASHPILQLRTAAQGHFKLDKRETQETETFILEKPSRAQGYQRAVEEVRFEVCLKAGWRWTERSLLMGTEQSDRREGRRVWRD